MIVLFIAGFILGYYLIMSIATWVIQWGLTEITGQDMPFWPVFWILVVLSLIIGGLTQGAKK